MARFIADFPPISLLNPQEIAWMILPDDDGVPYQYDGISLALNIGTKRIVDSPEPIVTLTSDNDEMEWRLDEESGAVYPVALFTAERIAAITESGTYSYDLIIDGVREFKGTIQFEGGVTE